MSCGKVTAASLGQTVDSVYLGAIFSSECATTSCHKTLCSGDFDLLRSGTGVSKPTKGVAMRDILKWVDH